LRYGADNEYGGFLTPQVTNFKLDRQKSGHIGDAGRADSTNYYKREANGGMKVKISMGEFDTPITNFMLDLQKKRPYGAARTVHTIKKWRKIEVLS